MIGDILIKSGFIVTGQEVVYGDLHIVNGRIANIYPEDSDTPPHGSYEIVDAKGFFVMPGMIDIHCDAIEKEIQPRPNTQFPLNMCFIEMDKKIAATGITTLYHALSMSGGTGVRSNEMVVQIIETIHALQSKRKQVKHRIHLRYEITNIEGYDIVERLLKEELVDMLSFMDHTPGQGQFARPGTYENYLLKTYNLQGEEAAAKTSRLKQLQGLVDWDKLIKLAQTAAQLHITVATHDDDRSEKIDFEASLESVLCEFPVNLETAVYGTAQGKKVSVGAPNLVRGNSHSNNMKAMDAVFADAAHIVCSDYMPTSMLPAVFKLIETGLSLPEAYKFVSLNPAALTGADSGLGSISKGKIADLILVELQEGYPIVRQTWVNGIRVYNNAYIVDVEPEKVLISADTRGRALEP